MVKRPLSHELYCPNGEHRLYARRTTRGQIARDKDSTPQCQSDSDDGRGIIGADAKQQRTKQSAKCEDPDNTKDAAASSVEKTLAQNQFEDL